MEKLEEKEEQVQIFKLGQAKKMVC